MSETTQVPVYRGNIKNSMPDKFYTVTAYACVLSDTFSLQEDILLELVPGELIAI